MPHILFSLMLALLQQPTLTVDKQATGRIGPETPKVEPPQLMAAGFPDKVVGQVWTFEVVESGPYHLRMHSWDFDSYLLIELADGTQIEDDSSWKRTHPQVQLDLQAGKKYRATACALYGDLGEYRIELRSGEAVALAGQPRWQAELEDIQAEIDFRSKDPANQMESLAIAHVDLGNQYYAAEKFSLATQQYRISLELRENAYGKDDPRLLSSLANLAFLLRTEGKLEEALLYMRRGMDMAIANLGEEHQNTATLMNNYSDLLEALGKLEQAIEYGRRALAIREKILGADHLEVGYSLNNLAIMVKDTGDFDGAEPLYLRSVQILEKHLGPNHPNTLMRRNNLARLYQEKGEYRRALKIFLEVEQGLQNAESARGLDWATCFDNLGTVYHTLGNFRQAEHYFYQSLERFTHAYGEGHYQTSVPMNNLGLLYEELGDLIKAEKYTAQAVAIREKALGADHPALATPLNNLALVQKGLGRLEEARTNHERARELIIRHRGKEHVTSVLTAINLASVLTRQGHFQGARNLLKEQLVLAPKSFGPDHPQMAIIFSIMAQNEALGGDFEIALDNYKRALDHCLRTVGPDHSSTALAMVNWGAALWGQGRNDEARELYQQALEIQQRLYGERSNEVATVINNLSTLASSEDRYQDALEGFHKALDIQRELFGEVHPKTNRMRRNIGSCLANQDQRPDAWEWHRAALQGTLDHLAQELPTMNEAGRMQILKVHADPQWLLVQLREWLLTDREAAAEKLVPTYSLFLQWKGSATRLQQASITLRRAASDDDLRALLGRLDEASQQLSRLILAPLAEQSDGHAQTLVDLRQQRLSLEREINRRLKLDQQLQTPEWNQVQQSLPADAVLVDFYVAKKVYAWIVHPTGAPELVTVGPSDNISSLLDTYLRQSLLRGARRLPQDQQDDPGIALAAALWHPLRQKIGNANVVFVSPDGFLGKLPFGTLPTGEGSFLLKQHRFHYLSDACQLVRKKGTSTAKEGPVLAVGGVNYFRREASGGDVDRADPNSDLESQSGQLRNRLGMNWSSLPATRAEIRALQDLHEFVLEWDSPFVSLTGKEATEEQVRIAMQGKKFVHLATHGYFEPEELPSLLVDAQVGDKEIDFDQQKEAVGMLPGLLSGLVFAGVNGDMEHSGDDGYLTAEEIQYLDLSDCALVVLSACETALGSARAGEGLMSLRRAFAVAGAESAVSSLWKVDDAATSELMKQFYANLWEKGMSRSQALHLAKLEQLRRNQAENDGDALPSTWGAFVLSGDWR